MRPKAITPVFVFKPVLNILSSGLWHRIKPLFLFIPVTYSFDLYPTTQLCYAGILQLGKLSNRKRDIHTPRGISSQFQSPNVFPMHNGAAVKPEREAGIRENIAIKGRPLF